MVSLSATARFVFLDRGWGGPTHIILGKTSESRSRPLRSRGSSPLDRNDEQCLSDYLSEKGLRSAGSHARRGRSLSRSESPAARGPDLRTGDERLEMRDGKR